MLKRSFLVYALLAILFLKTADNDFIHDQRGGYLWYLYEQAGQKKDISAAIVYFDYLRRLDPADITVWVDLVNAHMAANEPAKAREVLRLALRITPEDSKNYPLFLMMYKNIETN